MIKKKLGYVHKYRTYYRDVVLDCINLNVKSYSFIIEIPVVMKYVRCQYQMFALKYQTLCNCIYFIYCYSNL